MLFVADGPILLGFRRKAREKPRSLFTSDIDFGDEAGRYSKGSRINQQEGAILGWAVEVLEQGGVNSGFVIGELRRGTRLCKRWRSEKAKCQRANENQAQGGSEPAALEEVHNVILAESVVLIFV